MINRPFYTAAIHVSGCCYRVSINDCPILESNEADQCTVEIPINQWVHSGVNELNVALHSPEAAHIPGVSGAEISICVRESGSDRSARSVIAQVAFEYADERDIDFHCETIMGSWDWESCQQITDERATFSELGAELHRIHGILKRGDIDALIKLLHRKNADIARAGYTTLTSRAMSCRGTFQDLIDDPDMQLAPLELKDATLSVFGTRKLAKINAEDGSSPVFFVDAKWTIASYVNLVFCRGLEGTWEIVR